MSPYRSSDKNVLTKQYNLYRSCCRIHITAVISEKFGDVPVRDLEVMAWLNLERAHTYDFEGARLFVKATDEHKSHATVHDYRVELFWAATMTSSANKFT